MLRIYLLLVAFVALTATAACGESSFADTPIPVLPTETNLIPQTTPTNAPPTPTPTTTPTTAPAPQLMPPDDAGLTPAAICDTAPNPPEPPSGNTDFTTQDYVAIFETEKGSFRAMLYDDRANIFVENFINLACIGFYDETVFHRVIPGFISQGGDPEGTGRGGPGYRFADEFHPDLKHSSAGILSMANAGKDTNGSQFFITHDPTPHLDAYDSEGNAKDCSPRNISCHGVFGLVYEGLEIATNLEQGDELIKLSIKSYPSLDEN